MLIIWRKDSILLHVRRSFKDEPVVQKALNELQYLHKLWKEEAEPVAEEFRDSNQFDEFKEISKCYSPEKRTELFGTDRSRSENQSGEEK